MLNNLCQIGMDMSGKRWWQWLIGALSGLLLLSLLTRCGSIQDDIQHRAQGLLNDNKMEWATVSTDNRGRDIQLSGEAPDEETKAQAVNLVQGLDGVRTIDHDISIAASPNAGDPTTTASETPTTKATQDATQADAESTEQADKGSAHTANAAVALKQTEATQKPEQKNIQNEAARMTAEQSETVEEQARQLAALEAKKQKEAARITAEAEAFRKAAAEQAQKAALENQRRQMLAIQQMQAQQQRQAQAMQHMQMQRPMVPMQPVMVMPPPSYPVWTVPVYPAPQSVPTMPFTPQ